MFEKMRRIISRGERRKKPFNSLMDICLKIVVDESVIPLNSKKIIRKMNDAFTPLLSFSLLSSTKQSLLGSSFLLNSIFIMITAIIDNIMPIIFSLVGISLNIIRVMITGTIFPSFEKMFDSITPFFLILNS